MQMKTFLRLLVKLALLVGGAVIIIGSFIFILDSMGFKPPHPLEAKEFLPAILYITNGLYLASITVSKDV
jgi:hypothetical protein